MGIVGICEVQGKGFYSPKEGDNVRTRGIVFGDSDDRSPRGFFMQEQDCDSRSATSDGIFVYLGERIDVVSVGDEVEVVGTVNEYYGLTEIVVDPKDVLIRSQGNELPAAVELTPPFDDESARAYFEAVEGMHVQLSEGVVVGPTDRDDRSWFVRADLGIQRVFQGDPGGTGEIVCADDGGLYEINPEVKVGDQVNGLKGAMDFRGGIYCVQLYDIPQVFASTGVKPNPNTGHDTGDAEPLPVLQFSVATFNLANMFDTVDDPDTEDSVLSTTEYLRRLQKRALTIHDSLYEPSILVVQEVENTDVLQGLVNRPEIESEYQFVLENGPDARGLDLAVLYIVDRVQLLDYQVRQGCTDLVDGLGPDGNRDVENPQNAITCDTNNDGHPDGNRLFSRPPLLVHFRMCEGTCQGEIAEEAQVELYILNNHWKSKIQDTRTVQYTLARRVEQAKFVAGLVEEILTDHPDANLILLGDLNDYPDSEPISYLDDLLSNQTNRVPEEERYTYIYRGRSQVLEYLFVRTKPWLPADEVSAVHINADYPVVFETVSDSVYRSSDHDPLLAHFTTAELTFLIPLVFK